MSSVENHEWVDDYIEHPYTAELASRVKHNINGLHDGVDIDLVYNVITEALCQIQNDILSGRHIDVEYLGEFARSGDDASDAQRAVALNTRSGSLPPL